LQDESTLIPAANQPAVARPAGVFIVSQHKIICKDFTDLAVLAKMMD